MNFRNITTAVLFFLTVTSVNASEELLDAVYKDQTAKALSLLDNGAKANFQNAYGITTLSQACINGNEKVVKALIEKGADVNKEVTGESPLILAARTGKVAILKLLLDNGAQIEKNAKKPTAIMWAASEGHAQAVEFLISSGADPKASLKSGFSPLIFACRDGYRDVLKVLLKAGVKVNEPAKIVNGGGRGLPKGTTPLRIAIENGKFALAVDLLKAGADPNEQLSGAAALHVLTWVRRPKIGDNLDGLPAPPDNDDISSLEFTKILVNEFKADPNVVLKRSHGRSTVSKKGATPFLMACRTGDVAYAKLLFSLGADVKLVNSEGTNALLASVGAGSKTPSEEPGTEAEAIELAGWLMSLGLDINSVDKKGETVMHSVAYRNFPKVAEYLHEKGADIKIWNKKNKAARTPLLIAQGFRPGNFKPDEATTIALQKIMKSQGVEPPPAPERPLIGKKKAYQE